MFTRSTAAMAGTVGFKAPPGANSASYQTAALTASDDGATFYVTATHNGTTVSSPNAVITVGHLEALRNA